jgi:hypothetical protein
MPRKRHKPEDIIAKPPAPEVFVPRHDRAGHRVVAQGL